MPKFGWVKMITNNFRELNHKEMGAPVIGGETPEEKIVAEYVDEHKVIAEQTAETKPDGGPADYYDLPFKDWVTVNDMVEYLSEKQWGKHSWIFKDILKACTRFGEKSGTDKTYDTKKIIYYGCRLLMSVTDKATTRKYLQQLLDDKQFKENEQ